MKNILSLLLLTKTLAIEYVFESATKTWDDAEVYCNARYNTDLATIEDDVSAQTLLDLVNTQSSLAWMGLSDKAVEGAWVYADGTECDTSIGYCDAEYKYWYGPGGEPSGGGDCAEVYPTGSSEYGYVGVPLTSVEVGFLNDEGCTTLRAFVCNKPEPHYIAVSELMTWANARTYCQETYGTDLATIYDDDSAQQLLDLRDAEGLGNTWIGLNDIASEGNYVWADGTLCPSEYGNVCTPASGYPYWASGVGGDNSGGLEHCIHIYSSMTDTAMLNDIPCSNTFTFICNYESSGATGDEVTCPYGATQIGDVGADIGGCGLEDCTLRYEDLYPTIESCKEGCESNVDCISFSWAPLEGDRNHPDRTVCSLYDSLVPTTLDYGDSQIMCEVDLCSGGPSNFTWEDLMTDGDDYALKPNAVADLSVDDATLTLTVEVVADYLGYSQADDNGYLYGSTYVIDFEDFNAHSDDITEPGTCQNRAAGAFDGATWSQVWQYSITPNTAGHVGSTDYLAYAPGNKWNVEMSDADPCDIKYSTTLTWSELTSCTGYNSANGFYITTSDNEKNITLSGTLYINVVSPFDYNTDYGFYRVYQLLSQPFMIVISKTTYVLGDVGINLLTMDIIAVYKEDAENTFRLIVLTESAEYLELSRDTLGETTSLFQVFAPLDPLNEITDLNFRMLEPAESAASGCLTNKQYICSQLWQITADDVQCTAGGIFTDFSGIYSIQFTPQCREASALPGDTTTEQDQLKTYCDGWLVDHLDEITDSTAGGNVLLSADLTWKDEICDPVIFEVQFEASMVFYNDAWSTEVVAPYLFAVGDTVYVKVTTSYPENTFSVFATELLSVWICTFDPLTPPSDITVDSQAGGCFDSNADDNDFVARRYHNGVALDGFTLDETTTTLESNEIQFQLVVPDKVARDTLYIHAQIEVSLSSGRRRRRLLSVMAKQANQMEHFVDRVGISSEPKPKPKPQTPVNDYPHPQQPLTPIAPPPQPWIVSLQSPYVIAIICALGLILAINLVFMCYVNCVKPNQRARYAPIKFVDSSDFSEHDAINVASN